MAIIGGPRTYDGPGLGEGAWKCPACNAENTGLLADGCVVCRSGSARPFKVGQPPPMDDLRLPHPALQALAAEDRAVGGETASLLASEWIVAHPAASALEAFIAGYQLATAQSRARTMAAPPVSIDVEAYAPEGKTRRTIIAALELFRDQVLRDAQDEIASGEWCSIEEVDQLIRSFREEDGL